VRPEHLTLRFEPVAELMEQGSPLNNTVDEILTGERMTIRGLLVKKLSVAWQERTPRVAQNLANRDHKRNGEEDEDDGNREKRGAEPPR
jgi:hypothetical protein